MFATIKLCLKSQWVNYSLPQPLLRLSAAAPAPLCGNLPRRSPFSTVPACAGLPLSHHIPSQALQVLSGNASAAGGKLFYGLAALVLSSVT